MLTVYLCQSSEVGATYEVTTKPVYILLTCKRCICLYVDVIFYLTVHKIIVHNFRNKDSS